MINRITLHTHISWFFVCGMMCRFGFNSII